MFVTDTAYDSYYGRPKQLTYQSGESIWLRYSKYGHATREASWPAQADYRQVLTVNNRGQALSEKFGTQITASYAYTATTGQMTSAVYTTPSITIRQLGYQYDVFGNVLQQSLAGGSTTETYAYDQLQRLTQATRAGGASGAVSYQYDAAGNFTSKSDFSTTATNAYTYTGGTCGGGPNAVKSIALSAGQGGGTRSYCYDANGNLVSYSMSGGTAGSFLAKYDHDNLPYYTSRSAALASRTAGITYDADGARVRQTGTDGTRLYDGAYEKVLSPSIEEKVYIGDYAVLTKPSGGTTRVNYLLKDRLGSVDTVTDATGAIAEQRGYDAFGKPRQGSWADLTPPRLANIGNTPRGFTQHEHLNSVELIHMNGRAYDYNLGRFLSVDPIIQFPTNSQSLNPYSYIMNNPLSGTDPTGYSCEDVEGGKQCKFKVSVAGSRIKSDVTATLIGNDLTFSGNLVVGNDTLLSGTAVATLGLGVLGGSGGNGATGLSSLGNSRADGKGDRNQSVGSSRVDANRCRMGCHENDSYASTTSTQDLAKMGDAILGFAPITGEVTSIHELIFGESYLSGEPASRWWAAVGVVTLGYGKNLKYLGEAQDLIDPSMVRFSQKSVGATFRNGQSISNTAALLRGPGGDALAKQFPPIRLFEQDGLLFTLDNRRLLAFASAGRAVPYRMATAAEVAKELGRKLTTSDIESWGWYIKVRGTGE